MAMWLDPCVKTVLTTGIKSATVWTGRAKMKSIETVSKGKGLRAGLEEKRHIYCGRKSG